MIRTLQALRKRMETGGTVRKHFGKGGAVRDADRQGKGGAAMDWYPLYNSLRIAAISTIIVFLLGIFAAHRVTHLPRPARRALDVVLTLPLVLPPTVLGWLLFRFLSPRRLLGTWAMALFGTRLVMTWQSAIFAAVLVSFPLMYRTARGAFAHYDTDLSDAARTLGRSNLWTFWAVQLPVCREGILSGTLLAFARALGEYGATSMVAGYTPGRTATISTTVYQLWRTSDDAGAFRWVIFNLFLSAVFLTAVNLLESGSPVEKKATEGGL